mmetsp:Transcript_126420/g.223981  ORF Transcript_126420/g.223981 Transcript_126420/m.223981 type:complete len:227 (+) Transcript_126420:224-904(+)
MVHLLWRATAQSDLTGGFNFHCTTSSFLDVEYRVAANSEHAGDVLGTDVELPRSTSEGHICETLCRSTGRAQQAELILIGKLLSICEQSLIDHCFCISSVLCSRPLDKRVAALRVLFHTNFASRQALELVNRRPILADNAANHDRRNAHTPGEWHARQHVRSWHHLRHRPWRWQRRWRPWLLRVPLGCTAWRKWHYGVGCHLLLFPPAAAAAATPPTPAPASFRCS